MGRRFSLLLPSSPPWELQHFAFPPAAHGKVCCPTPCQQSMLSNFWRLARRQVKWYFNLFLICISLIHFTNFERRQEGEGGSVNRFADLVLDICPIGPGAPGGWHSGCSAHSCVSSPGPSACHGEDSPVCNG